MINEDNVRTVAFLIEEYGDAIRGDWGEIDGRVVKRELYTLSDLLYQEEPINVDHVRLNLSLCLLGSGHWDWHCSGYSCHTDDD